MKRKEKKELLQNIRVGIRLRTKSPQVFKSKKMYSRKKRENYE